jgi:hypothetical protein
MSEILVRRSTQDPLVYLQGQGRRADMAHIRVIHDPATVETVEAGISGS